MIDVEKIFRGTNEIMKQAIRDQQPDMVPDWAKTVDPAKIEKREFKLENDLQDEVQNWLHLRGYWRMSPEWIREETRPGRGWQFHMNPKKTKGNPIVLDIILFAWTGRFTMFELKRTHQAKWSSEEQRVLCEVHGFPVFNDFKPTVEHVLKWEDAA